MGACWWQRKTLRSFIRFSRPGQRAFGEFLAAGDLGWCGSLLMLREVMLSSWRRHTDDLWECVAHASGLSAPIQS